MPIDEKTCDGWVHIPVRRDDNSIEVETRELIMCRSCTEYHDGECHLTELHVKPNGFCSFAIKKEDSHE